MTSRKNKGGVMSELPKLVCDFCKSIVTSRKELKELRVGFGDVQDLCSVCFRRFKRVGDKVARKIKRG